MFVGRATLPRELPENTLPDGVARATASGTAAIQVAKAKANDWGYALEVRHTLGCVPGRAIFSLSIVVHHTRPWTSRSLHSIRA